MGTKLKNRRGKDLYDFWDDRINKTLNDELAGQDSPVLVNLASNEYFQICAAGKSKRSHRYPDLQGSAQRGLQIHLVYSQKGARP